MCKLLMISSFIQLICGRTFKMYNWGMILLIVPSIKLYLFQTQRGIIGSAKHPATNIILLLTHVAAVRLNTTNLLSE